MQRKPFPSETQERFIVRLPDGMRDRIAEAAKASDRSMNAEIVARMRQSFDMEGVAGMNPSLVEAAELKQAIAGLSQLLQEQKALFDVQKEAMVSEVLKRLQAERGAF